MADYVLLPSGASIELTTGTDYILLPTGESILETPAVGGANAPTGALQGPLVGCLGGPI